MRRLLSFCTFNLLICLSLYCQDLSWETATNTYAVVIGISDYQDEQRSDLKFAHKDAQVFANFLKSEAGGNVSEANIQLLLNEQATLAAIDNALNWLIEKPQKGERVIFYFSGHGDVEKQTLWQLGYLLAYDTPFNNYRNNAVRLEDLNDLVTTLSVSREAEVMVITDACRSGKLAGSDNRGPSLTAEQLAKQSANEVRILSCKPDQKSFEGKIWGGGRGVFSWHFINGIKGLADDDQDLKVTREEIEFYLRDKFREEQRSQNLQKRQTPQFSGNELFKLASVNQNELAVLRQELEDAAEELASTNSESTDVQAIVSRGEAEPLINTTEKSAFDELISSFEKGYNPTEFQIRQLFEELGEEVDTSVVYSIVENFPVSYNNSKSALIEAFSKIILEASANNHLSTAFKNQLAVALHNKAQLAINEYLSGDVRELKLRYNISWGNEFFSIPAWLELAAQLLNESHPLYQKIKVKYQYFDGVLTRLRSVVGTDYKGDLEKAIEKQKKTLSLDDKAAYVQNELGLLHLLIWTHEGANREDLFEKAESYFQKAIELSPTWVLPYANIGGLYGQKGELAATQKWTEKAINLKDDYFGSYLNLGMAYEYNGDLLNAESLYRKALYLAPAHYLPFYRMAYLTLSLGDYRQAEYFFDDAEARTFGIQFYAAPSAAYDTYTNTGEYTGFGVEPIFKRALLDDESINRLLKKVAKNPEDVESHYSLGIAYKDREEYDFAEKHLRAVIKLQHDYETVFDELEAIFLKRKQYEKAEILMNEQIRRHPDSTLLNFKFAELYHDWKRYDFEESIYRSLMERDMESKGDIYFIAYERLRDFLENFSRYREAEDLILKHQLSYRGSGILSDLTAFYDRMIGRFPNEVEWLEKKAIYKMSARHSMPEARNLYEWILEIDPNVKNGENMYYKIGDSYFTSNEFSSAVNALEKAIELAPDHLQSYFKLIQVYNNSYQFLKALPMLEKLEREGKIDLKNRKLLGDYYARMGQYEKSDTILRIAQNIVLDDYEAIHLLLGKLYMLAGDHEQSIEQFKKEIIQYPNNAFAPYSIASQYAAIGKTDEAFNFLEQALKKGFKFRNVLRYDSNWNALRDGEKFTELLLNYGILNIEIAEPGNE